MTLTPDEAKLVERLQGFVDACSGHDITLYEGHPAVLVAEAIAALIRIADERELAQQLYWKNRNFLDAKLAEFDAAESLAAQALRERDEAREALPGDHEWMLLLSAVENLRGGSSDPERRVEAAWRIAGELAKWADSIERARRALSEQPDKERMP